MKEENKNVKQLYDSFKTVKNCLLEGIYANKLDTYQVNKDLILYSVEPLLEIKKHNPSDIKYWKIDWTEDKTGDDILLLKEQKTPEPLEYEQIENHLKHVIMGSSFSVQNKLIKRVSGYGFIDSNSALLSSIVIELEDLYISIRTGPVIEIRIIDEEPHTSGDIIFST